MRAPTREEIDDVARIIQRIRPSGAKRQTHTSIAREILLAAGKVRGDQRSGKTTTTRDVLPKPRQRYQGPTPMQVDLMREAATGGLTHLSEERLRSARACERRGWIRRASVRWVITPIGRAALANFDARPRKVGVLRRIIVQVSRNPSDDPEPKESSVCTTASLARRQDRNAGSGVAKAEP